jgi:hypothetical protein
VRWREYYPLLRSGVEYPNELPAGPAAAVKNAVMPLHALKEAPVDMNESLTRVKKRQTILLAYYAVLKRIHEEGLICLINLKLTLKNASVVRNV